MIGQTDQRLKDWVRTVLNEVQVSLEIPTGLPAGLPVERPAGRAVSLYLLELINTPASRGAKRPPLQITLRYLVTASAPAPEQAHDLIAELMFAAMEDRDLEVERDAPPLDLWRALERAPRPAFLLRVPLRQERPETEVKLVRKLPVFRASALASLHGVVVGPDEIPMMGALVELPALSLSTRTDYRGRFAFPNIPAEGGAAVRVKAKGRELSVRAGEGRAPDEPLIIQFKTLGA